MGLLVGGKPVSWEETAAAADSVRRGACQQVIRLYREASQRAGDPFLFGDEVSLLFFPPENRDAVTTCFLPVTQMEYVIVRLDDEERAARLSLRASQLLSHSPLTQEAKESGVVLHPEACEFMLEAVPLHPFSLWDSDAGGDDGEEGEGDQKLQTCFAAVEESMVRRRKVIRAHLLPDERLLSLASFPQLGCGSGSTHPSFPVTPVNGVSGSRFLADQTISRNERYVAILANIRRRRLGRRTAILAPLFRDERTERPFQEGSLDIGSQDAAVIPDNHVFMDACAFGHSCCSLQVTLQPRDREEAVFLFDQLAVLAPLLTALTAAAPVHKGFLTDWDSRWMILAQASDERTLAEEASGRSRRWAPVPFYLSEGADAFNDVSGVDVDPHQLATLMAGGVDPMIARHFAHILSFDPLLLMPDHVKESEESIAHYLNLNSSVWQSLRLKLPESRRLGWRIEVRSMDVQPRDRENAAFVAFLILLSQVIMGLKLDLRIPMSRVHENLATAVTRSAATAGKFWFRKNALRSLNFFFTSGTKARDDLSGFKSATRKEESANCVLMTADEIVNGNPAAGWVGLVPLVRCFVATRVSLSDPKEVRCISRSLELVSGRASGVRATPAAWMRAYARLHPEYRRDSRFSQAMTYDLVRLLDVATATTGARRGSQARKLQKPATR